MYNHFQTLSSTLKYWLGGIGRPNIGKVCDRPFYFTPSIETLVGRGLCMVT